MREWRKFNDMPVAARVLVAFCLTVWVAGFIYWWSLWLSNPPAP
jgi:hypothetical protein